MADALDDAQKAGTDSVAIRSTDPHARMIRGWMQLAVGDFAQATQTLAVIVAIVRSSMVARFAAVPLIVLAQAQLALGEPGEAAAMLDEATSLARAGAMTWILGRAARIRAELRARQGDSHEAESLAHEAFTLGREAGDQLGLVDAVELLARLAASQDSHKEAIRLWAAAESRRPELRYARFPAEQGPPEAAVPAAAGRPCPNAFVAPPSHAHHLSPEQ